MSNYRYAEEDAKVLRDRVRDNRAGKGAKNASEGTESPAIPTSAVVKGTVSAPKLNKLETSYAQYLDTLLYSKQIVWWKDHPFNLRLSSMKCYYAIDFAAITKNMEIELIEIKGGHAWDDAIVKFKVASEQFPHFKFKFVTKEKGEFVERVAIAGRWQK